MKKTIILILVLMMTFMLTTSVFADTYPALDPTETSTPESQTFILGMNDLELIENYSGVQITTGSSTGDFAIGGLTSYFTQNPVGLGISGGQALINDCIAGRQAFIADVLEQMKAGEAEGLQVKITPNTTSNYPATYIELNNCQIVKKSLLS